MNVSSRMPSIFGIIRTNLQLTEEYSDAQIGMTLNIGILVVALVLHFLFKAFWTNGDNTYFERNVFYEIASKNKGLLVDLDKKEKEIKKLSEEIHELEARVEVVKAEGQISKETIAEKQKELEEERKAKQLAENERKVAMEEIDKAKNFTISVQQQLKISEDARSEVSSALVEANRALSMLESKLNDEKSEKEALLIQLEQAKQTIQQRETEKKELESQMSGMTVLLEEIEKSREFKRVQKSSGSGGWSDFDDDLVVQPLKSKTPQPAELRELSKLKNQLNELEKEHRKAMDKLEHEGEERRKLEDSNANLKAELDNKCREVATRDADRRGADKRANQLLELIQEGNVKIKEKEATIDKLSEQLEKLQNEIVALQEKLHTKENRVKDLDAEVKKLRIDYMRLEASSYCKESDYAFVPIPPPGSFDLPQISSFSKDVLPPPRSEQNSSVWDYMDLDSSIMKAISSPEDNFAGGLTAPVKFKPGRSHRSDKQCVEYSGGVENRREIKENQSNRRRSRSHGRKSMGSYVGGIPELPHPFFNQ